MEIVWGPKDNVLFAGARARDDKSPRRSARFTYPRGSTHMFVASNENGWVQTIILSQLNVLKRMQGVMLTMGHAFANIYSPVAVPVILSKHSKVETRMVGRMAPGDRSTRLIKRNSAVEAEGFASGAGRLKPAIVAHFDLGRAGRWPSAARPPSCGRASQNANRARSSARSGRSWPTVT
jgi:hypothetical protein